jgi:hypothetical protein
MVSIAVLLSNLGVCALAVYMVMYGHPGFAVFLVICRLASVKTRRK